jgi:hypothetical protein
MATCPKDGRQQGAACHFPARSKKQELARLHFAGQLSEWE